MRILLDSNAYSQLRQGHPRIAELVRASEQVILPFVVIGELFYGFRYGTRFEKNLGELREFLDHPRVTTVTMSLTTADRYGRIATALRAKGRPIPTNDIWIAAHAMETGTDLVSSDQHFEFVDGLAWIHVHVDP